MWYEMRRQQHRAYWRTEPVGRDYEVFPTEAQARAFIAVGKEFGRDKVVARHRARDAAAPTAVAAATPQHQSITAPALAAGLTAPTPGGISLAWLGEQYVTSGNRGNDNTRGDYHRDLQRYIYPFFGRQAGGEVDIAMIMTRPLPTRDGADWPWPTIAAWKTWLGQQPRHDRHGEPIPHTRLQDKTRRNIESLLSQVFNFALAYDPQPLLTRNPCTGLGLTTPEYSECVWLPSGSTPRVRSIVDDFECSCRPQRVDRLQNQLLRLNGVKPAS